MRLPIAVALLSLLSITTAHADSVQMKNGDRLSGTVVNMNGRSLMLRTPYAGEIKLPWSAVARVETDSPVTVMLNDGRLLSGQLNAPADGQFRLRIAATATTVAIDTTSMELAELAQINPPPEVSGQGASLSGRINVGTAATKGNSDTLNLHVDTEGIVRTLGNRYTLGLVANRTSDTGELTASNWRGYGKSDHFFSKRWYSYTNLSLENDQFRDISLRSAIGAGSGYQVFEGKVRNLSLEGGLNYVSIDHKLQRDNRYPSLRWALKYDEPFFHGLAQVFHEHEAFLNLQDTGDIFVRSKTGLRFPIEKHFNAAAQLDVDWDSTPSVGKTGLDRELLFSLGYVW